jgi:predicted ATP-binding protein involved in virulence
LIIESLQLTNFRRFDSLAVDFHKELTVIVARNGQGKTSVLDAITVALGTFVGAFDMGKAQHIEKSDARLERLNELPEGESQYPVSVGARFREPDVDVRRELSGPKNKTTIRDANDITEYGTQLQTLVRAGNLEPLPLVSYYGAGRLWKVHKNMERKQVLSASRTMGYEDCLSPSSNFVQCQQWMAKATFAHLQEQADSEEVRPTISMGDRLHAIEEAVNHVLAEEGWSDFRYSIAHEELTMFNPASGRLPVSMLSDGVRAMVSMVADIAFRCVRLNGYMGRYAARETQGIVLIDEVDIHLHPAWQQRVLQTLRDAFPKLQFIITTHSPQVLTTVKAECIRALVSVDGKTAVRSDFQFSEGAEAQLALEDIFGVSPRPQNLDVVKKLNEYLRLIATDQWHTEAAKALRQELDEWGRGHESALVQADMDIRMRQYRQQQGRG